MSIPNRNSFIYLPKDMFKMFITVQTSMGAAQISIKEITGQVLEARGISDEELLKAKL